jgi:hypothetical protein
MRVVYLENNTNKDRMATVLVNPKQFHRILVRKQNRLAIEQKFVKLKTLHYESRQKHAETRPRGGKGRFLKSSELRNTNNSSTNNETIKSNSNSHVVGDLNTSRNTEGNDLIHSNENNYDSDGFQSER